MRTSATVISVKKKFKRKTKVYKVLSLLIEAFYLACFYFNYSSFNVCLDYIHPVSSAVVMLGHMLCEKVPFPAMNGSMADCSCFQKECAFGICATCDAFLSSPDSVLQCPMLFSPTATYHWKAYADHILDNGNSIRELRQFHGSGVEYKEVFLTALAKYKKHYFVYRWLQFQRKFDIKHLSKYDIYIQTDYAAQPVLDSQDKLNSQGHGVCVLSCWIILHSREDLTYVDERGVTHHFAYYKCDHVRVVTPASGKCKDQDWFTHCKIFDHLLEIYIAEIPGLKNVHVWTDGAPNQYKCRQNFYWLSKVYERLGLKVIHKFGATAQFKGVHDKIGQIAKWIVK